MTKPETCLESLISGRHYKILQCQLCTIRDNIAACGLEKHVGLAGYARPTSHLIVASPRRHTMALMAACRGLLPPPLVFFTFLN